MNATPKKCPKCSKEMGWSQNVHVLPALHNPLAAIDPISTKTGFPVAVFCCPDCGYVELYRQPM